MRLQDLLQPLTCALIFSGSLLIGMVGCGKQAESTDWIENDGSYCKPSESSRTEDCYLGPNETGEYLEIHEVEDLDRVCSSPCTKIRNLTVNSFEGLRNLRAFQGLTVQHSAEIRQNPHLESTRGLDMADETAARIENNPKLQEITGFEDVQTSLGFVLTGSPNIRGLDTFERLQHVEGRFRIQDTSISDLSVLDGVRFNRDAHFWLRLNGSLRSIPAIEGEGLVVQIEENHDLKDVSGLLGLSELGGLTIFRNKSLKTCHAENVAEQISFQEMGEVSIRRNASGSCSN